MCTYGRVPVRREREGAQDAVTRSLFANLPISAVIRLLDCWFRGRP